MNIIETPMLTVAKFVRYTANREPLYFDGVSYWAVDKSGRIKEVEEE